MISCDVSDCQEGRWSLPVFDYVDTATTPPRRRGDLTIKPALSHARESNVGMDASEHTTQMNMQSIQITVQIL